MIAKILSFHSMYLALNYDLSGSVSAFKSIAPVSSNSSWGCTYTNHNYRKPLETWAMLVQCLSQFLKSLVENLPPISSLLWQNRFTDIKKTKIPNLLRLKSMWQIKKSSSIFRTREFIFPTAYQFPLSISPLFHTNCLSFTKKSLF